MDEEKKEKGSKEYRSDGYVNMLNKFGTVKDTTEHYHYVKDPEVPDQLLTEMYTGNGLFARIIDAPAEEATRHGFSLDGIKDNDVQNYAMEKLDDLDWEEVFQTCIKWQRLFGGAIAVMLIDDGRGIDEPVDWNNIKSIDDIYVYDRHVVQPDWTSMFSYNYNGAVDAKNCRLGTPEYYHVFSRYGTFTVHASRCLIFKNGVMPENCENAHYQYWGIPEYVRIRRGLRDAEIAHESGPKMLDKSVQAVYKMQGLSAELSTEEGEDRVAQRLQAIDYARGVLGTITIDAEGEDYDFRTFSYNGVSEVIDISCNMLSAITNIPQTILFGRAPAGMNATGQSDMENWYAFIERIQKKSMKSNLRYLLDVIFRAALNNGEIDEMPKLQIKFEPLWSMTELEKAQLDQTKAQVQQTRAATATAYVQMGVLDPSEVRKALGAEEDFDIETMLDDMTEEELMETMPQQQGGMPGMGGMPGGDMSEEDMDKIAAQMGGGQGQEGQDEEQSDEGEDRHGEYDTAIKRAAGEYSHEDYDKAIKEAASGESEADKHEAYDKAIRAAIESQRKYSHEDYAKAIARALGINKNKDKAEKNSENILTSVKNGDSLEAKVNADASEPKKWITVNGNHVPLDESGNAIGGPLEGQNFSEAKSEESSGKGENKTEETEKTETSDVPKESGGDEHKVKFGEVSSEEFCPALAKAKDDLRKEQETEGKPITSWRVSYLTPEEIAKYHPGARMHVTEGGSTVAVDDNHDIFAVCVSPNEGGKVRGKDLIKMAIEQGGDRLDSFSGNHGFYTKLGFEPVTWCTFSLEAAPPDWNEKYGEEPVIFYKYTGNYKAQDFDDLQSWFANTAPIKDYEEAKKARDEAIKKDKGEE